MYTFLMTLHIVLCILLIFIILMQPGKGADISSAFGGGSASQLFGAAGSGNLFTRGTGVLAALFMVTSIGLALFSTTGSGALDNLKPQDGEEEGSGFGNSVPADKSLPPLGLPPLDAPAAPEGAAPTPDNAAPASDAVPAPAAAPAPAPAPATEPAK